MKLPYYALFTSKFGKQNGSILYLLLAIIVAVLAYRLLQEGVSLLKSAIGSRQSRKLDDFLEQQIYQAADGTVPTTSEVSSFEDQAQVIADMQHAAMEGPGTDYTALVNQLIDLEGWQLAMVAQKFGVRPYSNLLWSQDLNIFGWYDEELCDSCTVCLQYKDDRVPGCEEDSGTFLCNGCTERGFMRGIWAKTGIPN